MWGPVSMIIEKLGRLISRKILQLPNQQFLKTVKDFLFVEHPIAESTLKH